MTIPAGWVLIPRTKRAHWFGAATAQSACGQVWFSSRKAKDVAKDAPPSACLSCRRVLEATMPATRTHAPVAACLEFEE